MNAPRLIIPSVVRGLALLAAVGLATGSRAQSKTVRLSGNVSPEVAKATMLGRLDARETVQFAFTLPVRNQAALDDYLKRLYTPGDPLYRQYLLTDEFASLYGPTQGDYDQVIAFAQRSGLKVKATYSNRLVVDVSGPSAAVETALGVNMVRRQAASGRSFHSPDKEPAVPGELAALGVGVVALDNAIEPQPDLIRLPRSQGPETNFYATGPAGLAPADIKTFYNLNGITQDGTGQTIAILEFDGFVMSDIRNYESSFHLPTTTINIIPVGVISGFPTAPTMKTPSPSGPVECCLDIELVNAIAPNATMNVYEGTVFLDVITKAANDNTSQVVSMSYHFGLDSTPSQSARTAENAVFMQMAAQGQSFYCSSGDYGSSVSTGNDSNGNVITAFGVADPVAQPFVTGVGGTVLDNNTDYTYKSEVAWSGGGGGVSTVWPIPVYQSASVSPGSGGSSTLRNVPDVSLNAYSGYSVYETSGYPTASGSWQAIGGTSAACPLWAAYTVLVNQYRASISAGKLGFANPTIYFVSRLRYAADFHDITTGNNGTFSAVAGYDNVTGWGTFNGGALFSDLTHNATVYHVNANYTGSVANGGVATPYKKIADALNAASASNPTLIYIRGAAYNETFTTSKPVIMVNEGNGNATLGASVVH